MGFYRCMPSSSGGGGDAASYTATIDGELAAQASLAYAFYANNNINGAIVIGDNVTNCTYMFQSSQFNGPVTIGKNVKNCRYMFSQAVLFNQPLTIPANVNDLWYLFANARSFNSPVTFLGNNFTSMEGVFQGCGNYNQSIIIPHGVTGTYAMFNNAKNFNQDVYIPSTVYGLYNMFRNAWNFGKNIYINNANGALNCTNMMISMNNSIRKNIFLSNLQAITSLSGASSIVGASISWSAITNGYYNARYNIYLYSNYSGT